MTFLRQKFINFIFFLIIFHNLSPLELEIVFCCVYFELENNDDDEEDEKELPVVGEDAPEERGERGDDVVEEVFEGEQEGEQQGE